MFASVRSALLAGERSVAGEVGWPLPALVHAAAPSPRLAARASAAKVARGVGFCITGFYPALYIGNPGRGCQSIPPWGIVRP